ncbi:MAG: hypothetical protein QW273_00480 [Candidatus Pacearchaeota archaeon]
MKNFVKEKVLEIFKEKGGELSTKDICSYIYEDYDLVRHSHEKNSKEEVAKVHRRILHHLNELVKEGVLKVAKHGEKGLKFFILNLNEGEEIVSLNQKFKKRRTISKPLLPSLPIESYEERGLIRVYEKDNWVERVNSIYIDCTKIEKLKEIEEIIREGLEVINDSLCIENFEELLKKNKTEEVIYFFERIIKEFEDYGKIFNLIINPTRIKEIDISILEYLIKKEPVVTIFNLNSDNFYNAYPSLKEIFSLFAKERKIINIKNDKFTKSPIFIGKAGPYSFTPEEWKNKEEARVYCCSQSSLIFDVEKFYSDYGVSVQKFSEVMLNISRSLFYLNYVQRKKAEELFFSLKEQLKKEKKEFLELSRHYIRLWNYSLSIMDSYKQEEIINMINEAKKKIESFSIAEETIYKSCGMPIRFKLALSCAFRKSLEELSEAKYKRLGIYDFNNLYEQKIRKEIKYRESISDLFNGGNDVSFHRLGDYDIEDIIREVFFILNNMRFPFFSYNLEGIKNSVKLTDYL